MTEMAIAPVEQAEETEETAAYRWFLEEVIAKRNDTRAMQEKRRWIQVSLVANPYWPRSKHGLFLRILQTYPIAFGFAFTRTVFQAQIDFVDGRFVLQWDSMRSEPLERYQIAEWWSRDVAALGRGKPSAILTQPVSLMR